MKATLSFYQLTELELDVPEDFADMSLDELVTLASDEAWDNATATTDDDHRACLTVEMPDGSLEEAFPE